MIYAFAIIAAYLLGSIPMGLILTKVAGHGDLRKVGSGNIGATNVMRVGGLWLAGMVWMMDMLKAICAVIIGGAVAGVDFAAWCGVIAVVGHCWPVWLRFRGGKGVSSMFGVVLAISPLSFVICGIEWLMVALGLGYSSLGALTVMVVLPMLGFAISWPVGFAFLTMVAISMWRHRENIARLVGGTESKIEWKWKK